MVDRMMKLFRGAEDELPRQPRGRMPVISTIRLPNGTSFKVLRKDILDAALRLRKTAA